MFYKGFGEGYVIDEDNINNNHNRGAPKNVVMGSWSTPTRRAITSSRAMKLVAQVSSSSNNKRQPTYLEEIVEYRG